MNNRQNGRRRGRGGQQARNGQPGGAGNGSRVDNRARGNAAQLLEKYKTLARDAQMQGDRVNTEYYLQFADHYFRVLSEARARFEEQRPQRSQGDDRDDFANDDGDDQDRADQGDDGSWDDGESEQPAPRVARVQPGSGDRDGRRERGRYAGNANGNGQAEAAAARATRSSDEGGFAPDFMSQRIEAPAGNPQLDEDVAAAERQPAVPGEEPPRRTRRPRKPRAEAVVEAEA
jgi:hypothetical protein